MSSPSPSPNNATTMLDPLKTPAAKKKEDYEDYDLSPPKVTEAKRQTFDEAVRAIKHDFNELRVEWGENEEMRKLVWFMKQDDGTEAELPSDFRRIMLFLYSRNFKKDVGKVHRKAAVKNMLKKGRIRQIILQVIECNGDNSLSFDKDYRAHYIRACLTIHRYFEQTGATGFVPDMSSFTFYLRMQKFGSCFLQAACVAISYLLQAHGVPVSPPDASRLVRHHFNDDQLIKYIVEDHGGDSVGIFKILEEKFFVFQKSNRDPTPFLCHGLGIEAMPFVTMRLKEGPGLVSKFTIPDNFVCSPPSSDLKEKFPRLASYQNWKEIPAEEIPPGLARFTTWNEPAEFIPLNAPSDAGLKENECTLKEKWKALLLRSVEDVDDRSTSITASMSAGSSSCLADNGSLVSPSERSTTGNAPMSKFMDDDAGDDWSHFLNPDHDDDYFSASYEDHDDDDDDDDNSSASYEDHEAGEGAAEISLHAMVLLGHHTVGGSGYWLLQNSWEGPMQLIEVTTEYFIESGAYLYFYSKEFRSPKPEHQWSSVLFCPSPVAESSRLERSDCENWTDDLVHSVPQQKQASSIDDILNDW
jgi:hypothetical protein